MTKSTRGPTRPKRPIPKKGTALTEKIEKGRAELTDEELNKVSAGSPLAKPFGDGT